MSGDIILQKCTITYNHMIYGSWDMEWDEQKFLSFWTIFCPFTPATTQKIKILKQWKKPGDTIILNKCTINYNSMMYDSWDMEWDRQNFLSFWTISWPFIAPNDPKNQNFETMEKNPGDIIILLKCAKNHDHMLYCSWHMACDRTNFYFSF